LAVHAPGCGKDGTNIYLPGIGIINIAAAGAPLGVRIIDGEDQTDQYKIKLSHLMLFYFHYGLPMLVALYLFLFIFKFFQMFFQ
jgi:hypothetical protein